MEMENVILSFDSLWQFFADNKIDLEIVFEDGVTHKITDPVELIWSTDNKCLCLNPT